MEQMKHQQYNRAVGELFKMYVEGLASKGITDHKSFLTTHEPIY